MSRAPVLLAVVVVALNVGMVLVALAAGLGAL